MAYEIAFWLGKRVVGRKPWPSTLDTAIAHARAHFPIPHTGLTSVSIIDGRTRRTVYSFNGTQRFSTEHYIATHSVAAGGAQPPRQPPAAR